jgi:hypothetical protein
MYLYPQLTTYGPDVLKRLSNMSEVFIGDKIRESENTFHVVVPNPVQTCEKIYDCYFDFKLKKYVAVVRMLDKFKLRMDKFWTGDYRNLYSDAELKSMLIFPTNGNKINLQYHMLKGTDLGILEFKKNLVAWKYVDVDRFKDWDTFNPGQADMPPNRKQEILHED